jgi:tetratricopeptide (TPR) repeat protein
MVGFRVEDIHLFEERYKMFQFGTCPRCKSDIDEKRLASNPVICQACGFTPNVAGRRVAAQIERKFLKTSLAITFVLVAGFIQAVNWDRYAVEIVPLKIKQWTHTASTMDLMRINLVCRERLKHDCVESALSDMSQSGQLEALAELGKYQAKRGRKAQAANSLAQYFSQGGLDLEANYQYAKVLSELGQIDQAASRFDQVIKARPETLQITVTQHYVHMLMNNGRRDQALALIKGVRGTSPEASLFMETEFKALAPQARLK